MNYFFLLLWFIFTASILGTVILFVLFNIVKTKIQEKRGKKDGNEEKENENN